MDKVEAKEIAERDLEFYRALSYTEFAAKIGEQENFERITEQGEPYRIEFDFMFDDDEQKTVRVMGIVSYNGWTDLFPVSNDFIIAPNGEFIGE